MHSRCALKVYVTDLIVGSGQYGTNTRRAKGHASLITKKTEMHFNLARRLCDCWLRSLWH
jgi:hypothetical protein